MKANPGQCSFLAIYNIQFAHVLGVFHQVYGKFEGVSFIIICVSVFLWYQRVHNIIGFE